MKTNTENATSVICPSHSTKKKNQDDYESDENDSESMKNSNLDSQPELRRIESVKQKIKSYQQKKSIIKTALANLDTTSNKKIIFDDNFNGTETENNCSESKNQKKRVLFESDEEEEEEAYNFEVKNQFEGERGQELFQLQSKFKGDRRFVLDERFIDEENENSENSATEDANISLETEKKNEINILEEVLGTKIKSKDAKLQKKDLIKRNMLRFDPAQSEHMQYQMSPIEKPKKIKTTNFDESKSNENIPEPLVSKDVYYEVSKDLKNSLQAQDGFSLLHLFSKETDKDDELEEKEEPVEHEEIKKNKFSLGKNPFRYDSSDDEMDNAKVDVGNEHIESQPIEASNTERIYHEPFFFKEDDYRLQEGSDFIKRLASETNVEFVEQRRNLKHIIKAKVKNNQRKNNPFKKKLGGNKRRKIMRIKKALKR